MDEPKELDWSDPKVRRLYCSAEGREVLDQNYLVEGIGLWLMELQMDHDYGTYLSRLRHKPCVCKFDFKLEAEMMNWLDRESFVRALGMRNEAMRSKINEDLSNNYISVKSGLLKSTPTVKNDVAILIFGEDVSHISGDNCGECDNDIESEDDVLKAYNSAIKSSFSHPFPFDAYDEAFDSALENLMNRWASITEHEN